MSNGMLWFDNSKESLESKIKKAMAYYENKYGTKPNECLVHPNTLINEALKIDGVSIRSYRPVLPGHIWIGMEETKTKTKKGGENV